MDKTYTKTFNIACSVMQIAGTKENPGECSQAKSNAYREKLFYRREVFPFSRNIKVVSVCIKNYRRHNINSIEQTPNYKCPICNVPKAAYQKDYKCISDFHPYSAFASA